jgi:hypothetical protein
MTAEQSVEADNNDRSPLSERVYFAIAVTGYGTAGVNYGETTLDTTR